MKKYLLVLALLAQLVCVMTASAQKIEGLELIPDGSDMLRYGHLDISIAADTLLETFAFGDIVTVTIEGYGSYYVPVCPNYDDVSLGEYVLRTSPGKQAVILAVNYGQLAMDLGIVEFAPEGSEFVFQLKADVVLPINVTIELVEKGGYADRLAMGVLIRENDQAAYPELSDAEFANFREITTTGMGTGKLYRSSTPFDPQLGRCLIVDRLAEEANIKTFINLAYSETDAVAFEGFESSYYSTQNVVYLALPASFLTDDFRDGLAEGFRFMITHESPYLIHCVEGKDRAGFTAAVLEALMGADPEEIKADYVKTYTNYYDVQDGVQQPIAPDILEIIEGIIVRNLEAAFGVEDLTDTDLQQAAFDYLLSIGLTADEIEQLKTNLS